ncbi:MAG: hypothetical protein AAGD35_05610 [Actinomycetota bacterium]
MRLPLPRPLLRRAPTATIPAGVAVVAVLAATAVGCSDEPLAIPPEQPAPPGASVVTPSASPPEAPPPEAPSSPRSTPDALRVFVADMDEPDPAILAFVDEATDVELASLAETTCALLDSEMSAADLGASVLLAHDQLDLDDRIGTDSFSLVFGALAGLHCPDRLPISGERTAPTYRTPSLLAEADGWWPADHPVAAVLDSMENERLDRLGVAACALADGARSTAEIGAAAEIHRSEHLHQTERRLLDRETHAELFGALVGWYCPGLLPRR